MAEHALIATLEAPLTGNSTCVAVKRGKDTLDENKKVVKTGACQCARYGPSGTGPGFKSLCRQASLPIVIAGKHFSTGGQEMARALALPPPMDFSPVDGFEDLGFFERVFDMNMAMPALSALGGGAIGGAAYSYIAGTKYFDKDWKKSLLAVGLGFAGGRALWGEPSSNDQHPEVQVRRNMAKGHIGAMGAILGGQLVSYLTAMTAKKPAASETDTTQQQTMQDEPADGTTDGLFGNLRRYALNDADVDTTGRFADVDVDNENVFAGVGDGVSSWIS